MVCPKTKQKGLSRLGFLLRHLELFKKSPLLRPAERPFCTAER